MRHQVRDRVVRNHAIRVDADVDLLVDPLQRVVQRVRLAAVRLGQHRQAAGGDIGRIGLARHVVGPVRRSVVDDDDADVLVVRHHHGADRPDDHLLFVVRGNQHGDPRLIVRRREVLSLAQPVDDGEDADDDQPPAHQHVADEEDAHHKVVEEAVEEEGDGVGARLPALARRQRRHHLGARLAHQLRYGNDLVAARSQRLDQHRQRVNRGLAVAASVVQKDDRASIPRAWSPYPLSAERRCR